jgi:hypothetical protein
MSHTTTPKGTAQGASTPTNPNINTYKSKDVRGRFVLVSHPYPFTSKKKTQWVQFLAFSHNFGLVAVLVAQWFYHRRTELFYYGSCLYLVGVMRDDDNVFIMTDAWIDREA